jgi:hypothetical protein
LANVKKIFSSETAWQIFLTLANQKQELPLFVGGMGRNEETL